MDRDNLVTQIAGLRAQQEAFQQDLAPLEKRHEAIALRIFESETREQELSDTIASVNVALDQARSEIKQLQETRQVLLSGIATAKSDMSTLRDDLSQAEVRLSDVRARVSERQAKHQELTSRNSELSHTSADLEASIAIRTQESASLRTQSAELLRDVDQHQRQVLKQEKTLQDLTQRISTLRIEEMEVSRQRDSARRTLKNLENRRIEMVLEIEQLDTSRATTGEDLAKLRAKRDAVRSDIDDLESQRAKIASRIVSLVNDARGLAKQFNTNSAVPALETMADNPGKVLPGLAVPPDQGSLQAPSSDKTGAK